MAMQNIALKINANSMHRTPLVKRMWAKVLKNVRFNAKKDQI